MEGVAIEDKLANIRILNLMIRIHTIFPLQNIQMNGGLGDVHVWSSKVSEFRQRCSTRITNSQGQCVEYLMNEV